MVLASRPSGTLNRSFYNSSGRIGQETAVADTKERILEASSDLFRRQGYAGTGMNQIVERAEAALGSIYHFFPGGKEQLGEESIRRSGEIYGQLIDAVFDPAPDVVTAVGDFFAAAAEHLEATDYEDACPIATVALEVASTNETLRRATSDVFEGWIAGTTDRLHKGGIRRDRAHELAVSLLALLEGSFVLSRASRSVEPLLIARRHATKLVSTAPMSTARRNTRRSRPPDRARSGDGGSVSG
jgi:AcrR family transcriptional regulator